MTRNLVVLLGSLAIGLLAPASDGLRAQVESVEAGFALDNGDTNGDGYRDLSDGVYLLGYLYSGGPAPVPLAQCAGWDADVDNGDVNGDGMRDVSDAVSFLNWLYSGTAEPVSPCGSVLALAGGGGWHGSVPRIIPPQVRAYGRTYAELAGAWWSWALALPGDSNPIVDETGEFCGEGQQGKVWFLAGTFGGPEQTVRHCTVPAGKAIFLALLNNLFVTPEEGTVEEVRALANEPTDRASVLECSIDGVSVADIFAYRAQSPPGGFPFEVVEGSILIDWGLEPRGPEPAVSDGYWLYLPPLSAGEHVIEFHGVVGDPAAPDFELSVKYILTVEGRPPHHGGD